MNEQIPTNEKLEHRLTKLEVSLDNVTKQQETNHKELLSEFKMLRKKVNEEITTMQQTINVVKAEALARVESGKKEALSRVAENRKYYIRLLIITIAVGSLLWIEESREWILKHVFQII